LERGRGAKTPFFFGAYALVIFNSIYSAPAPVKLSSFVVLRSQKTFKNSVTFNNIAAYIKVKTETESHLVKTAIGFAAQAAQCDIVLTICHSRYCDSDCGSKELPGRNELCCLSCKEKSNAF
jgi:hypothetical protein